MPSENTTTCHGASRITLRVDIRCPRAATPSSTSAPAPATALIGTPIRPSPKNPASSNTSPAQPAMKVVLATNDERGCFKLGREHDVTPGNKRRLLYRLTRAQN